MIVYGGQAEKNKNMKPKETENIGRDQESDGSNEVGRERSGR